jgi:hypothetical protein
MGPAHITQVLYEDLEAFNDQHIFARVCSIARPTPHTFRLAQPLTAKNGEDFAYSRSLAKLVRQVHFPANEN